MGCVSSKVHKEETVRRCRERKMAMKQLISCRAELAAAHLDYLRSLKNTGATLRQFTEVESSVMSHPVIGSGIAYGNPLLRLPPSPPPPPPLPPSPPPPPPLFISGSKKEENEEKEEKEEKEEVNVGNVDKVDGGEEEEDDDDSESFSPPPPPMQGSAWVFWDPFGPPSSSDSSSKDEEGWAEANAEFREEEEDEEEEEEGKIVGCGEIENVVVKEEEEKGALTKGKELMDDSSSVVSILTKDTEMDMGLVVWRTRKTMAGIVKEIDDYFLKAAAGGSEVVLLLEPNRGHSIQRNVEQVQGKGSKSAKVFSALSWNWYFKSPQSSKGACTQVASDASRPCNHSATLERIYAKEHMLYKEVKEEELAKVLLRKKRLLLEKLESRDNDQIRTGQIRSNIEDLQSQILSLQESISETCFSISKLRDEELYPQLTELTFGLMQMWRTMYECHQVQNHIAQQANLLDRHPGVEPTTDSQRFATAQLETEVTFWYSSFCNLLRSLRHYVQLLTQWVALTDCLPDSSEVTGSSFGIRALCEEWLLALDRLPDKVAAEAIKSFVSVIQSILLQQKEEGNLQKKCRRLESRLEKEVNVDLDKQQEEEKGSAGNIGLGVAAKVEALKKRVEEEKSKYVNSVGKSRAMTVNNLQTSLPNLFQALMGFAGVCVQAFEDLPHLRPPTVEPAPSC